MRILWLLCFCFSSLTVPAQRLYTLEGQAQGTYYVVKCVGTQLDSASLHEGVKDIFKQLDRSMSLYQSNSLIVRFNQGRKILMDRHMRIVMKKAQETSQITGGLFDVTVKPYVDLWGFGVHRHQNGIPTDSALKQTATRVGYQKLILRANYLIKKDPRVEIDCNGIAQGYTVDVIRAYLKSKGIHNFLIDVGGELYGLGRNAQGNKWSVGISVPHETGSNALHPKWIYLDDAGIATSGNYERFFDSGGKRFAHTINPLNGQAIHNQIISVTVLAPDVLTADAFDNAFILMGVQEGLAFIEKNPKLKLKAFYLYQDAEGKIQTAHSPGFFDTTP
jgi:thiamine biosynthesis lipoprotein